MPPNDFISDILTSGDATPAPSAGFISDMLAKSPPPSGDAVAPSTTDPSNMWDFRNAVAQGALLGGFAPAKAYVQSMLHGTPYSDERAKVQSAQDAYARDYPTRSLVGELGGSLPTTIGAMALGQEYAAAPMAARLAAMAPRTAEFLATADGVLPWVARATGRLASYGAQGIISGEMQQGLTDESPGEAAKSGAIGGMIAGPLGSALASPLKSALSPAVRSIATKFGDLGVDLRTNQLPGAPVATRYLSAAPTENQLGQFTKALSNTFGEDASAITPELLHGSKSAPGAFDRIGGQLENAARGSSIPTNDAVMLGRLQSTLQRAANEFGTDSPEYAKVARLVKGVSDAGETGTLSGNAYLDLTQKGSSIKNAMARTSPTRQYAVEFKDALDDALQRNNPAQAQDIAQARHQWHNALIAEDNVDPATGLANPRTLLGSVESGRHYGSAYRASTKATAATDSGDIGTLAVGGKAFLSSPPSGAINFAQHHPVLTIGAGMGLEGARPFLEPGIEHLVGGHPFATAATLGGAASYAGLGAAMNRPGYANMLLRGVDPVARSPNALIPIENYLYGRQGQGAGQ